MTARRPMVLGPGGFLQQLQSGDTLIGGALRFGGTGPLPGDTITATTKTAFATKAALPPGLLVPIGTRLRHLQFGTYSSTGVTPRITPYLELGGVALIVPRQIMGLIGDTAVPWNAEAHFKVTPAGIVGGGNLSIADNQTRIFGQAGPVTGLDLTQALDFVSLAKWEQAGCSITAQDWLLEVIPPTT